MAFNVEKVGDSITIIKGGEDDKTVIYLNPNYENLDNNDEVGLKKKQKQKSIHYFDHLDLKDGKFEPYPDIKRERDCGMIVGASGSGKSYYVNMYMNNYRKAFKKRPIYFFSMIAEDKSINPDLVKRVKLDESWISDPLTIDDVKDCLCVFDDIEQIKNVQIKIKIFEFVNEILTTGRHTNTSIFLIVHYANNKSYLRDMLNECHTFTYFPRSGNRATNYLLENYIGVDPKEIKKIKSLNTRWATIYKNYPNCVMTEKNLFMLANLL